MSLALVTFALLRQNRWILLMLALWPVAMALILLWPNAAPDQDDVLSVLHQECFYALALVSVTGASQLGNEQRSRRTVFVLARSVSRAQYLLCGLLSTLIASLSFTLSFLLCGFVLVRESGGDYAAVIAMAALQFFFCIWFAAFGVLFSVFLPAILAAVAVSLCAGAIFILGRDTEMFGMTRLISHMLTIPLNLTEAASGISAVGIVSILAQSVFAFVFATYLFQRRDLQMKEN